MKKKYLDNLITIEELVHFYDNYSKNEKSTGKVYTPKYISDYIVKKINPTLSETIFEPSVGHGIFIFSLLEFIEEKYNLSGEDLSFYFLNNVYAMDIDENTISELNDLIILFFKKRGVNIQLNKNINVGNTLFEVKKTFDIIIGNPPYVRTKNISEKDLVQLRNKFNSCLKGNIDLYYAFIEFAYNHSTRFSFITPNSWIINSSAFNLRKLIKSSLVELIDFKHKMIFKNADTYTSILLSDKSVISENLIYKNNLDDGIVFNKNNLDNKRWSFYHIIKEDIEVIAFHTPIATLSDKSFINVDFVNSDIIPFYKLSKIKSEKDFLNNKNNILFPYKYPSFQIKDEKDFNRITFDYLLSIKSILLKRDNGKTDKYEKWYAYGRKQGLNIYLEDTFFIIIPGIIGLNYTFFSISSKEISKPFLFSSGFLLEVDKKNVNKIITFLNSSKFKEFLKNEGKVWKGKEPYFSLSIKQLKQLFNLVG